MCPMAKRVQSTSASAAASSRHFFVEQGAKALVLACNTATAAGVTELRELYPDLPIIGMEPAVKPAAAATRSGVVGVLATTGTLKAPGSLRC